MQNDFAARMDWCTKSYSEANHQPQVVVSPSNELNVKSGQVFTLDASQSSDPDGDNLSFLWFCYPEAGSGRAIEQMGAPNIHRVSFAAPKVDQPEDFHIILKVTDKGTPQLTRYQRVVVKVEP